MKELCIFLSGTIFGFILCGIIGLTILDNRIDKLEPSLEQLNNEILAAKRAVEDLVLPLKDLTTVAGNARGIVKDSIQLIRDEANSYNKADTEGE